MRSRWSTLIVNHSRSARAGLSAAAVTIGLGGAFGALTAFAPTASATPAPGLGADFSCLATDIYGVAGPTIYDYQTASIDGSAVTGTAASTDLPSGDSLNAFGISPGGTMAYAVDTSTKHVEQYDPVSETWTDLGAVPAGVSAIKGAVDPLNGDFYFSGSNNEFYEYDPTTNTTSTTAVSITNVSGTGNGDAAFDAQGDLYLVATNSLAFVTAAQLAAGGSEAATVVSTGVLSGGSGPNGIAFTSDGKLYISTSSDPMKERGAVPA